MTESNKFSALPGLPAYREAPLQFSSTGMGMHSEGFVVEFFPPQNPSWIGNFQRGLTSLDKVLRHPDGESAIVIAGGECYIVDVSERRLIENFGGQFTSVMQVPNKSMVVLESPTGFEAVGSNGRVWRSKRVSWDGIRNVVIHEDQLIGEAWNLDSWLPFRLDLDTGKHEGGANC
jgi:hypothetical protein